MAVEEIDRVKEKILHEVSKIVDNLYRPCEDDYDKRLQIIDEIKLALFDYVCSISIENTTLNLKKEVEEWKTKCKDYRECITSLQDSIEEQEAKSQKAIEALEEMLEGYWLRRREPKLKIEEIELTLKEIKEDPK